MNNHYVKFLNIHGDEYYWIQETNYLDLFTLGNGVEPKSAFKISGIKMLRDAYEKRRIEQEKGIHSNITPLKIILNFKTIEWGVMDKDE